MKFFVDLDGVFADLDAKLNELSFNDPQYTITDDDWRYIASLQPLLFYQLNLLPGAVELWQFLEPLGAVILTATPATFYDAAEQKRRWVVRHLHSTSIITCTQKHDYSSPSHVLIDDMIKHQSAWEKRGGIFIHHKDVKATIDSVRSIIDK
jgi:5'(3')-deoxyribonucleotidase